MTGALSPTHWAIIAVVLLVLFGAKRLPDAARGLGQSLRVFRAEIAAPAAEPAKPGETPAASPAPEGEAARKDDSGT